MPSRRPASPGCGVSTACDTARGACASRFNASASSTSARSSSARTVCHSACAQASWPSPGPSATTLALRNNGASAAASSTACAIASGQRASSGATCALRVATLTRPAPLRRADSALSITAPPLPRLPPTHSTCPESPLWLSCRRGARWRRKAPTVQACARGAQSANAAGGTSSVASARSPTWFKAAPVCKPACATMNCKVSVAGRTAPGTLPDSASTPLGTSSASTGAPSPPSAPSSAASSASGARLRPMPSNASTTTSAGASAASNSSMRPPTPM
ncbi:hypothetical protein NB717_002780 [Xanthomonas sacchari]|nr:hypothetical protein [Xanthomonas sacchari]